MPFAVVTLALLSAIVISATLTTPVTEIFQDASDNGLGDAVNDVLNQAAESETGEKIRGVGNTIGNLNETAGDAIQNTMDAARRWG
ncbi:MAG: hypothetical protein IJQ98_05200 [Oscillospiraceae bacterium]|nr:hypothetical protein [Oscillospiraceae bacterium]